MVGDLKKELDQAVLDTMVTITQAMRILEVNSRNTVEHYIRKGKCTVIWMGSARLLYRDEVLAVRKAKDIDNT
jgi:hypothetical protein